MERGEWILAKWGSIRRQGWRMAPVMGREVVEDWGGWGGERNATAATSGQITCLIPHYVVSIGWSAVNSLTRGYTPVRSTGSQGLSTLPCWKITLLIDQVVGWQCMATSACSPWVHTWPCLSVLVVEPEIDRHASMRAMESLAIPFEQPAHSDWAAHRGKQRFTKPAYANSINRFKPAHIEIQGRNLEKESKRDNKKKTERERDFVWRRKRHSFAPCSHSAEMLIKHAANSTPTHPNSLWQSHSLMCVHFRIILTSSGPDKNT